MDLVSDRPALLRGDPFRRRRLGGGLVAGAYSHPGFAK